MPGSSGLYRAGRTFLEVEDVVVGLVPAEGEGKWVNREALFPSLLLI